MSYESSALMIHLILGTYKLSTCLLLWLIFYYYSEVTVPLRLHLSGYLPVLSLILVASRAPSSASFATLTRLSASRGTFGSSLQLIFISGSPGYSVSCEGSVSLTLGVVDLVRGVFLPPLSNLANCFASLSNSSEYVSGLCLPRCGCNAFQVFNFGVWHHAVCFLH